MDREFLQYMEDISKTTKTTIVPFAYQKNSCSGVQEFELYKKYLSPTTGVNHVKYV